MGFTKAMEKTIFRCWVGWGVVEGFAVGGIEIVKRWMDWFWMVWIVSVMLLLVSCGLFHMFLVSGFGLKLYLISKESAFHVLCEESEALVI